MTTEKFGVPTAHPASVNLSQKIRYQKQEIDKSTVQQTKPIQFAVWQILLGVWHAFLSRKVDTIVL